MAGKKARGYRASLLTQCVAARLRQALGHGHRLGAAVILHAETLIAAGSGHLGAGRESLKPLDRLTRGHGAHLNRLSRLLAFVGSLCHMRVPFCLGRDGGFGFLFRFPSEIIDPVKRVGLAHTHAQRAPAEPLKHRRHRLVLLAIPLVPLLKATFAEKHGLVGVDFAVFVDGFVARVRVNAVAFCLRGDADAAFAARDFLPLRKFDSCHGSNTASMSFGSPVLLE